MIFKIGDLVENYRLEELVGEGGSGCLVYRATDQKLDRPAALKILPAKYAADPEFHRRFLREAQLTARLGDEKHVIPVYGFGETADGAARHLYLAMKYVDGPSLAGYIRLQGALSLYETCVILEQVAGALDAAHAAGLVHRDVKPSNVLISMIGGRPFAYVSDFGSALRLDVTSMTTSLMVGTPQYLAPERWSGGQPSAAADLYALGCVAYACLTGHAPFAGDGSEQLAYAHRNLEPPQLSGGPRNVSPAVDAVLARAVAKNPADRHRTCAEFVAELKQAAEFLHDVPTPLPGWTPPPVVAEPPSRSVPRRRATVALGAMATAVTVVGVLALTGAGDSAVSGAPVAAGTGSPAENVTTEQSAGPDVNALAADAEGNLYFANRGTGTVRKLAPDGTVTRFAGGNGEGFGGDGGPADQAQLDHPHGLAVDREGNVYIADTGNDRVRMVDPTGTITTIAGNGAATSTGDTGPATRAALNAPVDVAIDARDRLYVAESDGRRVRMIDGNGRISTVAGTGTEGFSGDNGPATQARLDLPLSIATHGGDLYIADATNRRIRRVDAAGTITTVVGTGEIGNEGDGGLATAAELTTPDGIAVSPDGVLYIADHDDHRVRAVDTTGIITTVAGTGVAGFSGDRGPATQAHLAQPQAVLAAADGSVYVADTGSERIRRIGPDGTIVTITGDTPEYPRDGQKATSAFLSEPQVARVGSDGMLYIADSDNNRIRRVDGEGIITTVAGTGEPGDAGDGGPATEALLDYPSGVAMDSKGNLFIADQDNDRIRKVDKDGTISTVAGTGSPSGTRLDSPVDVVVDRQDNLYVAEYDGDRVVRIDGAGALSLVAGTGETGFSGDGGPATQADLSSPAGVHVTADGTVYIADLDNARVRKVSPDGIISTVAGTGTVGSDGDGGPAASAQLTEPSTVAVDDTGAVYIGDGEAGRVRRVDPSGTITTFAGTGSDGEPEDDEPAGSADITQPAGVAVAGGDVYISDTVDDQVYVVADGRIRRVAGPG
jgi:sugar lactone lactonase YvrE